MAMKPEDLGYNDRLKKFGLAENLEGFEVGRVISEHKERYIVKTKKGEFEAEITGNLRFSAKSREDFPAVDDWVVLTIYDPDFSIIHKILPRFSIISRQAVSQFERFRLLRQILITRYWYRLLTEILTSTDFKDT